MKKLSKVELEIINVSLGLIIKLNRLENEYSQLELGIRSNTDNTIVGRIERAEHVSNWQNLYKVSQQLGLDYCSLFIMKSKEELLELVDKCFKFETKLTKEKHRYYEELKVRIHNLFDQLDQTTKII